MRGDDCDDQHADVYTGAKEKCDDRDDDCNGKVDDHSRGPFGALGHGPEPTTPGLANAGGWAVPFGTGVMALYSYVQTNAARYELNAEYYDDTGAFLSRVRVNHVGPNAPQLLAAGGGPSSATVLYRLTHSTTPSTRLLTLQGTNPIVVATSRELVAAGQGAPVGDIARAGDSWIVGFGELDAAGTRGQLQLVAADGTQLSGALLPTPNSDGMIGGSLRVGAGPSGMAAACTLPGGGIAITTFGASLAPQAGPFVLPNALPADSPALLAIAGSAGGFVVAWQST